MSLEAVTFDYWNTLIHEPGGTTQQHRLDAWTGILEDAGFACERERLHAVFASSWERFTMAWKQNEQYRAVEAAEHILEELGFDLPGDVREELLQAFTEAGAQIDLLPTDNVDECLRVLKGAGIRLGIICDVGMTPSSMLRAHLDKHGLLDLFDHWSFSDEVGVYKPHRVIFDHALRGLGGVAPGRTAHVGDLRRTDVAGALAMGMTAVRYTGVFDDDSQPDPEAHHVVTDHADLPAALGVV
jgi:putative hydrolase of the HAD superfamily